VIPQALCTRYALTIAAQTSWLVQLLIYLCFPISWPISKFLDWILGEGEGILLRRTELMELVNIHGQENKGPLSRDEMTIIKGALDMKHKKVTAVMTPLSSVFMIPIELAFTKETLRMIYETGHSRIPVYKDSKQNIVGLLITKRLLLIDPNEGITLPQLDIPPLPTVPESMELYDMLNEFQTGKSHMVGVLDDVTKCILGIVTLEDVIEELIQEEIIDETDVFVDVTKRIRVFTRQLITSPGKPRKGGTELNKITVAEEKPLLGSK